MTDGAQRFVGATTFSALASRAGADVAVGRPRPDPAHHASARGRPDRGGARPPPGCWRPTPRATRHDLLTTTLHRHPGAGRGLPGDAHRDVGAPGGAGQPGPAARAAACIVVDPEAGSPGRRRRRRRPPGRARRPSSPRPADRAGSARPSGDLDGPARARHRRRHPRADRPGPVHRQPRPRASRATPWPRRPTAAGRRGHAGHHHRSSPVPAGRRAGARSRPRPRCTTAIMERAAARRRRGHGRRGRGLPPGHGRPTTSSRRATGVPEIVLRAHRRHPRRPRCRPSPPGQTLVGLRGRDVGRRAPTPRAS